MKLTNRLACFATLATLALAAHADTALYFDGSTYIDTTKFEALTGNISLSAWIRVSTNIFKVNPHNTSGTIYYGAGIVGQGYYGGETGFGILANSGANTPADTSNDGISWQVRVKSNASAANQNFASGTYKSEGGTIFTGDEWHHYLLVRDKAAGKARFYVDGVLLDEQAFKKDIVLTPSRNFLIGKNGADPGGCFVGYVADVALWNVALDATDAALLTQVRPYMIGKQPYAFFPLDEGTGSGILNTVSENSYPKTAGTFKWENDPTLHRMADIDAPAFATAPVITLRQRIGTVATSLSSVGTGEVANVSLWVGTAKNEQSLVQSGEALTVMTNAPISLVHNFPAFNTPYFWQVRAVSENGTEAHSPIMSATPTDKATYTWKTTVASGNWNDSGNWDDGVGGDSFGYPCTVNSTAYFAPGTVAAIHFPESVSFGMLNATNRNIDISFTAAQDVAVTNDNFRMGLTGGDFAGRGRVALHGVEWYSTTSGCGLYAGRELILDGGSKVSFNGLYAYQKAYTYWPEARIEVRDGSSLTTRANTAISGNATLLISNATVCVNGAFYCDYATGSSLKDGGGRVRFEGKHPLLSVTGSACTASGNNSYSTRDSNFDFLVPEGGYDAPPFQYSGTSGEFMKPTSTSTKLRRFNILPESPAVLSGEALEQTLVSLAKATTTTYISLNPSDPASQTLVKAADNKSIVFSQQAASGILTVTATPAKLAGPDYTAHTGLANGATLTLTCPATATDYPYVTCGGYRLYDVAADGTRTEVAGSPFAGTTCNYVHGGGRRELEWIWNVPELYVATTGDDANSGADWDNALKSPQMALDRYRYAKVFLAAGTYSSSKTFNVTNAITLVGCGATPSDTKLVHVTSELRVLKIANSSAVVTNLLVTNNGTQLQGGVEMSGGLLVGCVVTNCYTKLNAYHGGGIYLTGGTVRNCSICYNMAYDSGGAYKYGGGIYMTGGLVETCHIIGNTHSTNAGGSPGRGGGIYMTAGTVRNCLVARNWARETGYGIYEAGGKVENCTIVANNYTAADSSGRAFVVLEGATAINNIVVENYNVNGLANRSVESYNAIWQNNCIDPLITRNGVPWGDGNVNVDPAFTDFAHRDYTLGGFSACVNGGKELGWHAGAKDLNGNPRVIGPVADMGCFERAASSGLECSFTAVSDGGVDSSAITLSALADGNLEGATYIWTITDQDGNSVTNFSAGSSATTSVTLGPRLYTVSLMVTNSAGATAEATLENVVRVKTSLAYLNAAGSDTRPYATLAEGAHDVASALEMLADGGTLLVADGIYTISDRVNLDSGHGFTIRSLNGPDNAVIRAVSSTQFSSAALPLFQLASSKARLEGLTIVGGRPGPYNATDFKTYNAVVMSASGAVITNCVIRDVHGVDRGPTGTGMSLSAGTVVDVQILNCEILMSGGSPKNAAAVNMTGGTLERVIISNCFTTGTSSGTSLGAAVYMTGGSMRNSLITACNGSWAPVFFVGGSAKVDNTTIAGNTTSYTETSTSGGNTLYHVAGLIVSSAADATAKIRNCIVAENIDKKCGESNLYWRASWAAKVSNTLVAVPNATTGKDAYGNIATPSANFRNSAARDYTLKGSSPARDAGAWLTDWMTDASLDLTHRPRVFGHNVDMGCYECTSPFATLLLLQ